MNRKAYIFSIAAVFVTACVFDFLIHRVALTGLYHQTANVWRPLQEMQTLPMYVSQLLFAMIFVYIFTLHFERKGCMEGIRYGSYIGLLLAAIDLCTYTYLPIPFVLTLSWMGAVIIKCMLCGLMTAVVYNEY